MDASHEEPEEHGDGQGVVVDLDLDLDFFDLIDADEDAVTFAFLSRRRFAFRSADSATSSNWNCSDLSS